MRIRAHLSESRRDGDESRQADTQFFNQSTPTHPITKMSAFSSTQPAMQRKTGTVTTLPSSGRVVKRRASRACQCCQSRKVKCDVVERGIPCTKCRLDKVECAVSNSKKRKWRHSGELSSHSPDPPHDTSEECPPQEEINAQRNCGTLDDFLSTMPFGLLDLELNHHASHEIGMSSACKLHTCRLTVTRSNQRSSRQSRATSAPYLVGYSIITSELTFARGNVKLSPFRTT